MTIYDIAKEAGVSPSSVSRVVNGKPGVNRVNRKIIEDLLKKYDYLPNETARGLVTKKTGLVGILVKDIRSQHLIEGTHFIVNRLNKYGYPTMIINAGDTDEDMTQSLIRLRQHSIEALIMMGSMFQTEAVRKAVTRYCRNIPVFMMNGYFELPNVYGVLSDEMRGVTRCVQILAENGKKNIVFLVDKPTQSSHMKERGFLEGLEQIGLNTEDAVIYRMVDQSLAGGLEAMVEVLREHPETNGVICSQDIIACGAVNAIRERGMKVPEDIAVIGTDNSVYAEICYPKLTSLDNMITDACDMIVSKLLDVMDGIETSKRVVLKSSVIKRASA
ncbi:MAG: LacI family DNA-binding transcriptional regulator [Lachnospiraceae bacterium]|nr:LacI family DNA-binding transcriptional regulator [Lachnospiraceae bacterium]